VFAGQHQTLFFDSLKRVRLLAAILLASIAWGATAEFTHSHGFQAQWRRAQTVANSLDAYEAVESSSNSRTSSRSSSAAECLICQLHQNLSQTLLSHEPTTASAEAHTFAFDPDLSLHRADFSRSQRGRAPPVNL